LSSFLTMRSAISQSVNSHYDEIIKLAAIAEKRGKTLKLAEVAQIREFCESRDACKKFTALVIVAVLSDCLPC